MLSQRSHTKELLDRDDIPFGDIRQNMRELDTINEKLGGHQITLQGLRSLLPHIHESPVTVLEIGCGDGNNLRKIRKWANSKGISIACTGVDINRECIDYANSLESNKDISFICTDYKDLQLADKPHIIFSSLFCHHFPDEGIVEILKWKKENSRTGFFINDLHRHPLAYYSIKFLTKAFSKSHLVKNDAPLSVARSFIKGEWNRYLAKAGITNADVKWKWAFRWLIIYKHAGN